MTWDAVPTWSTTDLGTAAFAHYRGLRLIEASRAQGANFRFAFADPEGVGRKLQVEFLNSECRKYDESVRALKKLCHDAR